MSFRLSLFLAMAFLVGPVGCGYGPATVDPRYAAHRARLLLQTEPAGAVTVLDACESLAEAGEIVLVGQIGGVADPWTKGQASFVLADPSVTAPSGGHDHHDCGDNCPYCSKKEGKTSGLALVQFVDEQGRVLPIGAQQLFNLDTLQTVVVRGRAERTELGDVVVSASGLYIRR